MGPINRKGIAAVVTLLVVAGCQRVPTSVEAAGEPSFTEGGVGTLGSGNRSDSTTTTTAATEEAGVGTLGSGN